MLTPVLKKLTGISCALLLICSCSGKKESTPVYNDLFFDNLKGMVTKTEEISYSTGGPNGTLLIDSCCSNSIEYDDKGFRTRQRKVDLNGQERFGQEYTRFSNGLVKELKFIVNGMPVSTLISKLDKDGKYLNAEDLGPSGHPDFYYAEIMVNGYGKIISLKKYLPDSSFTGTIVNLYDRQIWIGGSVKDSNGKDINSTRIQLNKYMDPATETVTTTGNDGSVSTVTRYEYDSYDDKGNWTTKRELDEKGRSLRLIKRQITYSR